MHEEQIRHTLRCSADAYWRCVLDEEYNRRLYLDVLKYREFKPLGTERVETIVRRRIHVDPSMAGVPSAVVRAVKVFGDFSWIEEASFDTALQTLHLRYETKAMTDKTTITSDVLCTDLGSETCERLQSTSVAVRLFAVGPLVEKAILADIHKTFSGPAAEFTVAFTREKGW